VMGELLTHYINSASGYPRRLPPTSPQYGSKWQLNENRLMNVSY